MKSLTGLQRALAVLFPGIMVTLFLSVVSDGLLLAFFYKLQATGFADGAQAQRLDEIGAVMAVLAGVFRVVTGIVFLIWVHRAVANLHTASLPGLQLKPGGAVVEFFVPILNIFGPIITLRTVWSGTKFLTRADEHESWSEVKPSGRIIWWWMLFIGGNILVSVGNRIPEQVQSVALLINLTWLSVLGTVLLLPSAAMALSLVHQISEWQKVVELSPPADEQAVDALTDLVGDNTDDVLH